MNGRTRALDLFHAEFGGVPDLVVRAPGRVNLIGDHTDYNDGFVMPMALDRATWIAARVSGSSAVRVISEDRGLAGFDLRRLKKGEGWAEYLKGVAVMMQRAGLGTPGFEGAIATDVPVGAGLSSSAALEMAAALSFSTLAGDAWDGTAAARLAQRAENEWVGAPTGIMDQLVIATARDGAAKLIDCRTLEGSDRVLPAGIAVVVLDTRTRREVGESEYGERRQACERVAAALGVAALRDVTAADLDASGVAPADLVRARHVVDENARVLDAAAALETGDAVTAGKLMTASHASLRDLFEVSSLPFEAMISAAARAPGCLGARLTGGGFAGCAVALVEAGRVDEFTEATARAYRSRTGIDAAIYPSPPSAGASVEG